jgi:hypothetical protein
MVGFEVFGTHTGCAVAPANISGAAASHAAIPSRVIAVEKQYERVPIARIIKDDVVPQESRIDTIWEGEAPAFGMG